ncbi:MAG TPA: hypothetical protein PKA00_17705 [Saprospiraceae bacterium]|nr:hypothetical protein [Saprospiraceae bacterium]HMQ84758.1 hypothetical protein [Saprospiraceae bacterium]
MTLRYICLFWLLLPISGALLAQDDLLPVDVDEKVKAARVAFITQRLGLTSSESEKFWAVNNEYEAEKKTLEDKYKSAKSIESLSDKEAEDAIAKHFELEQKLLDLRKKYYERFREVVSARQVGLFYKADREFRLELLKKIRERQAGNNRAPGNRPFRN